MPHETGTEATQPDAGSVAEGFLGDAADDRAASFVEEEDANKEAPHGQGDSDDAGEQDRQPEDLKVVLSIRGGRANRRHFPEDDFVIDLAAPVDADDKTGPQASAVG